MIVEDYKAIAQHCRALQARVLQVSTSDWTPEQIALFIEYFRMLSIGEIRTLPFRRWATSEELGYT